MKTTFLLCWLCGISLNNQQHTPSPKPRYTIVRNNRLLDLMTSELTPKNLRAVYGKNFRVAQTTKSIHDPAVRDTVLVAITSADKLKVFKNKYNTFLISAALMSQRLSFGRGIRIGATKAAFCKAFGLNPAHDAYEIMDMPDGTVGISFLFKSNTLVEVNYRIVYDVD
ncbi:MAG: hypothetical protein ACRYFX_15545 [Janthinobacterium lividum]